MSGRLTGRLAIITGGSRGIGEAIAVAYAREGARVVIASRKLEGIQAAAERINAVYPGAAIPMVCHVGKVETIPAFVQEVENKHGIPDILVNNAATNPYFGPMLDLEWSAWDKTFQVNLKGTFAMSREVASRLILSNRSGSIINMSSVYGTVGAPYQSIYAMTKAAMISMTRTMAVELGPADIRVNAIAPGLVDTRFASAIVSNPDLVRIFTERAPLHRYARPDEIAGMAVFLASSDASYITGQTIPIDGGYTIA
ncbi:MAG: glucose 1-dehydrogenase [Myxococcota bacterium]|nr:glucose 1-dehydrogenase [Myxococcota bacterium]